LAILDCCCPRINGTAVEILNFLRGIETFQACGKWNSRADYLLVRSVQDNHYMNIQFLPYGLFLVESSPRLRFFYEELIQSMASPLRKYSVRYLKIKFLKITNSNRQRILGPDNTEVRNEETTYDFSPASSLSEILFS